MSLRARAPSGSRAAASVAVFLGYDVVLDGWQDLVSSALATVAGWAKCHPAAPAAVTRLETGLAALLQEGWEIDRAIVEQLSAAAAALFARRGAGGCSST